MSTHNINNNKNTYIDVHSLQWLVVQIDASRLLDFLKLDQVTIQCFACAAQPAAVHPGLVSTTVFTTSDPLQHVQVYIRDSLRNNYVSLCIAVYSVYTNSDVGAWKGMHCIGYARMMLDKLHEGTSMEVAVVHARSKVGSSISIQALNSAQSKLLYASSAAASKVVQVSLIDTRRASAQWKEAQTAMLKLLSNHSQSIMNAQTTYHTTFHPRPPLFSEINVRGIRMSIGVYLHSLQRLMVVPKDFEATMMWWLCIAKSNAGVNVKTRVRDLLQDTVTEVIADMFTLLVKSWYYSHDSIRTQGGAGEYRQEDQWSAILSFPEVGQACSDCEDNTIAVMQLLNEFMAARFANVELCELQACLQRYTPCFTLGQIRSGGTDDKPSFVLHAFPILLDSRHFYNTPSDKYEPVIVLETTNDLSTLYTKMTDKQYASSSSATFDKQDEVFDGLASTQGGRIDDSLDVHWRFVLHMKAPVSRVVSNRVFGAIHSIYAWQWQSEHITHYHVMDTTEKHIGVDSFHVFQNKGFNVNSVHSFDTADYATVQLILNEQMPVTLPVFRNTFAHVSLPLAGMYRYTLKHVDDDTTNTLLKQLQQHYKHRKIVTTRVELVDKCVVHLVDVHK